MNNNLKIISKLDNYAFRLSSVKNLNDLTSTIEEIVKEIVSVDFIKLYFFNSFEKSLKLFYSKGFTKTGKKAIKKHYKFKDLIRTYESKIYKYIPIISKSFDNEHKNYLNQNINSIICLPVLYHFEPVGVIELGSSSVDFFSEEQISMLTFVSNLSGLGYEYLNYVKSNIESKKALKESEENYQSLSDATFEAILIFDDNICINQNKFSEELFGYTHKEIIGKYITEWVAPEYTDKFLEKFKSDRKKPFETVARKKDGTEFFAEVRMQKSRYKDKNVKIIAVRDISWQKQIEKELIKSKEQFSNIVKNANDGIYLRNLDGTIVFANDKFAEIQGYTVDEVIGMKSWDLLHPEVRENLKNSEDHKNVQKGKHTAGESRGITKSGEIVHLEIRTAPFKVEGKLIGIFGIIRDISERKKAEEALFESEERFKALSNATFEAIFISENGICINQNNAAEEMFGYSLEESLGKPGTHWIAPEYHDIVMQNMMSGYELPYEVLAQRKDGKKFYVEIQGKHGHYKGKNVRVSALRDITQQRKARQDLMESEEKFRTFTEQEILGMYIVENDKLIYINESMANIFGCSREEMLSWDIDDFFNNIHPKDIGKAKKQYNDSFSKDPKTYEIRILSGSKKTKWIKTFTKGYKKKDKKLIYGISIEITELIAVQRKLKVAKEKAEEASKAKSEFIANVSHEIRTPMNAILGFSEILLNKIETPKYRNHLNAILSSGNALMSIINNILDLSKIEAGKLEIEPEPIQINTLFEEIQQIFFHKTDEKDIMFTVSIDRNVPSVLMIDEVRMSQILFNLVGNALKFTEKGYIDLSCRVKKTNIKNFVNLFITVKDTGIGISQSQLSRIFDVFTQQSSQNTRKYGGSGLGLAITKRLVNKMNGEVNVVSELGKGSEFTVKLKNVEVVADYTKKSKKEENFNCKYIFEKSTVLIVDDIDVNISMIENIIDCKNITFLKANSGEKALNILESETPDLIFMDLKMHGLSGYQTAEIIRKNIKTGNIPIVAFSASILTKEEAKINEVFDGYLRKPATGNDVLRELTKYLKYTKKTDKTKNNNKKGNLNIISKPVKVSPKIKEIISNKFYKKWNSLKDDLIIFEIEQFSDELYDFALENDLQLIQEYSLLIKYHTESLDIDKIKKQINDFPKLTEKHQIEL